MIERRVVLFLKEFIENLQMETYRNCTNCSLDEQLVFFWLLCLGSMGEKVSFDSFLTTDHFS